MRIAIFGGTFDPIHQAHLAIAREAADRFELDQVLFIPAANPPHKVSGTPYADRLRMVQLACATDPRFIASPLEDRPEKSYSVHTIERLQQPGRELFFIIGSDAFAEIKSWYRWQDVLSAVRFIVVPRPGHPFEIPLGARVDVLDNVTLPVSSSAIRKRLNEEAAQLPPGVAEYIRAHGLYA